MRVHFVLIALLVMSSQAQEKIPVEIETPHGTVAWKELPREKDGKIAQFLRELTPKELESLKSDAKQAGQFVVRYAPNAKEAEHPLDEFDFAFASWLASDDPNKESSDLVIRILGCGYFTNFSGYSRNGLVRLFPDGTVDETFDSRFGYTKCGSTDRKIARWSLDNLQMGLLYITSLGDYTHYEKTTQNARLVDGLDAICQSSPSVSRHKWSCYIDIFEFGRGGRNVAICPAQV
jgi:hypothetical protein